MLRKIKKIILQDPIVLAAPLKTNLDNRPITVNLLTPKEKMMDTVQKIALALLIVPFCRRHLRPEIAFRKWLSTIGQ
ncbi:MAG: hypothetical protein ACI9EW_000919 [Cellvibrionaceae bacterium]|jgi:hypothetical protein